MNSLLARIGWVIVASVLLNVVLGLVEAPRGIAIACSIGLGLFWIEPKPKKVQYD
jgi:hypothetical protein